jgi:hypothetical protein
MSTNTQDEEWSVVTKQHKNVMRRRGRQQSNRSQQGRAKVHHSSLGTTSSVLDPVSLYASLSTCKRLLIETAFFQKALKSVEAALHQTTVGAEPSLAILRQLVCYGVGNFSHTSISLYSSSLWQLAWFLCLRDQLQSQTPETSSISLLYYDPCSTLLEETFLTDKLHVTVLTINERGNRPIDGIPTLFFMPHCPSTLYENVLWANWHELQSQTSFVIVGNSLLKHCEALQVKPADDFPCMNALLPWLQEDRLDTWPRKKYEDLPGNFEGAFNDTYVSFFGCHNSKEGPGSCPQRPYDTLRDATEGDSEVL